MNNSYGWFSGSSLKYSGMEDNKISLLLLSKREAERIIPPYRGLFSFILPNQFKTSVLPVVCSKYGGDDVVLGQAYELLS